MALFNDWLEDVVRAKGLMWIASRNDMAASISQAGPSIQFGPAGHWIATLPAGEVNQLRLEEPEHFEQWDAEYGDRINEVVFIGVEMDRTAVEVSLDGCLLTDEEMRADWAAFEDPLPQWHTA